MSIRSSKRIRDLRRAYEQEVMFDGAKGIIEACHLGAMRMLEGETFKDDEEREMTYCIHLGMIVKDIYEGPVRNRMTYEEYRDMAENDIREYLDECKKRTEDKENEAAEESGYRIVE